MKPWPAEDQVEFMNPWDDEQVYSPLLVPANIDGAVCHFRNDFFSWCVKGLNAFLVFDWEAGELELGGVKRADHSI